MLEQRGANAAFNLQIADSVSSFKQLGLVNYNLIAHVPKKPPDGKSEFVADVRDCISPHAL